MSAEHHGDTHFDTIHRQTPTRISRAVLQFCNDRVVDVFLLLSEKLGAHGVERVAAELVVALHDLEHVELQPSFHVDGFRVALTVRLGREMRVFDFGANANHAAEKGKIGKLERLCAVQEIGEVKVGRVVADYHVGIDFFHKLAPGQEQLSLGAKLEYLGADNVGACVECEDVANEWLGLSVAGNHGRNLNDRVDVGLGEDALATGTLDIERKDAERGDLQVISLGLV